MLHTATLVWYAHLPFQFFHFSQQLTCVPNHRGVLQICRQNLIHQQQQSIGHNCRRKSGDFQLKVSKNNEDWIFASSVDCTNIGQCNNRSEVYSVYCTTLSINLFF
jgi:hypothetical protein